MAFESQAIDSGLLLETKKKKKDTTLVGFCAGKCHTQSY